MKESKFPKIITFANQKGGVGKTTLCACFANFLVGKGHNIRVIDCDRQQSIMRCRQRDIRLMGEDFLPYPVDGYRNMTRETCNSIISAHLRENKNETILFDCPGAMTDSWLIPIIGNSDAVIIPFHYDNITVISTSEFILYTKKIFDSLQRPESADIFMIPNITDKRVGTKEEREKWELTKEKYSQYGTVTPPVCKKADMERISTISALDMQQKIVEESFNLIYTKLYGQE